eukprot:32020_4
MYTVERKGVIGVVQKAVSKKKFGGTDICYVSLAAKSPSISGKVDNVLSYVNPQGNSRRSDEISSQSSHMPTATAYIQKLHARS